MGQLERSQDKLKVANGILLFKDRIVVPQQLRLEVLEAVHAQHHLGTSGTLQSLRKSYFGLRWREIPESFCRRCLTCNAPSQQAQEENQFRNEDQ